MPEDIHEVLDDAKERCDTLAKEIEAYKSARELETRATETLESMVKTIGELSDKIAPFTTLEFRKLKRYLLISNTVNVLLLLAVLVLLVLNSEW
ncbi:MAG: hypothetical protein K9N51_03115 [Candidatus Pacebacteria bacterium]|nr:hypothetical protein [Candidatus Paceibacterota bacterium]